MYALNTVIVSYEIKFLINCTNKLHLLKIYFI